MKLRLSVVVLTLIEGIASCAGHPEFSRSLSAAEHDRRQHLANKRHLAARNCARSIDSHHASRRVKRGLEAQIPIVGGENYEHMVHSYTCVTAPEIEEGPYYVNNEFIRQDVREDQNGVNLWLDIGVIDTATCEPIPDAFIELWSANATGVYGAFESANSGSDPPGRRPHDDIPRPPRPPVGPGGPEHGGPPMSSSNTWLRGGFKTDDSGTVELTTIYPGFYPGRTVHVHLMVRTGWEKADNGTIISHSGSLRHIGQLFFEESWNDVVLNTTSYLDNTAHRTLNSQDHDFARATIEGSSAIVQLELVNDTVENGLLGFITVAVDTIADYIIHSGNYLNSSEPAIDAGLDV